MHSFFIYNLFYLFLFSFSIICVSVLRFSVFISILQAAPCPGSFIQIKGMRMNAYPASVKYSGNTTYGHDCSRILARINPSSRSVVIASPNLLQFTVRS